MRPTVNCIILDDEPLAVQLLEDYARKIPALNVLYAGTDAYAAMEVLGANPVDLVFLDIQMPELTGMEFMQLFNREHNFIITSAYQEYVLDAFRFHVVDFLVKPVTFARFHQSVEKFVQWQDAFKINAQPDHLFVRADRKHHKIAFDHILYIEGIRDYICIHTPEERIMVLDNMKDILEKLPTDRFIRIHRSYIIPTDKIKLVEGNRIRMQNLEYIPIGETYRKWVAEWVEKK